MEPLTTGLLDLLFELRDRNLSLTLGGGFGLFLKRRHLEQLGGRLLFEQLPVSRSTQDLDLFLRAEVLADFDQVQGLQQTLVRLGYQPDERAKYLKWNREIED